MLEGKKLRKIASNNVPSDQNTGKKVKVFLKASDFSMDCAFCGKISIKKQKTSVTQNLSFNLSLQIE